MVDAIADQSLRRMLPQQWAMAKQVEQQPATGNLGVMVAPRVVLPPVAVLEAGCAGYERRDEQARAEHDGTFPGAKG
jgi:hypothetical protein